MLFLARNQELVTDREKTYLTAPISASDTTLTIKGVDSNAWADNDWIIVGEIGTKNAEILQINGAVSDGTSLTIDNAGSGGARFAHSVDEPVYRVDFNQIEFSRATTATGSKSVLVTNELQVDDTYTRYEDTSNTTGYGFVRFKNSATGTFSSYSAAIPYTGYTAKSLGRMLRMVRRQLGEPDFNTVTDEDITEEINEKQRDVAHERLWPFYEDTFSASSVAYQRDYQVHSSTVLGKVYTVKYDSRPLAKVDQARYDILTWDSNTTGEPTHAVIWNNKIRVWPLLDTAATSTTLNGTITSTATTITLTSGTGFRSPGRLIIDDEVISYEDISSAGLLRGVQRGLEGTTAAAHTTGATVTERDIIYTANVEPTDLSDIDDETAIPDPQVLVYGAAMEIAIGILKEETLHDRLKMKYDEKIKRLREKFGKKFTFSFPRIKDRFEAITDSGITRNPNDFPTGLS